MLNIWPHQAACLVIGHRGAMGYAPENTLISFEEAIRRGAESWLQMTFIWGELGGKFPSGELSGAEENSVIHRNSRGFGRECAD